MAKKTQKSYGKAKITKEQARKEGSKILGLKNKNSNISSKFYIPK